MLGVNEECVGVASAFWLQPSLLDRLPGGFKMDNLSGS